MPIYEYFCAKCGSKYELLRAAARADDAALCPAGHKGGARTLSVFATAGRSGGGEAPMGGGGCGCGGACSCGGH